MKSLAPSLLLLGTLTACASSPSPAPERASTLSRFYPMAPGSAWSYDVDTGDGDSVLAIARVKASDEKSATIQGGEGLTQYELRADGIYRTDREGYLLRMPLKQGASWPSGNGMQAQVSRTGVAMQTPAGSFAGCLEVTERGSASGAIIVTTYCPDVGPVEVVSSITLSHGDARVVARLRGYQIGP